jgi:hypothetical protein
MFSDLALRPKLEDASPPTPHLTGEAPNGAPHKPPTLLPADEKHAAEDRSMSEDEALAAEEEEPSHNDSIPSSDEYFPEEEPFLEPEPLDPSELENIVYPDSDPEDHQPQFVAITKYLHTSNEVIDTTIVSSDSDSASDSDPDSDTDEEEESPVSAAAYRTLLTWCRVAEAKNRALEAENAELKTAMSDMVDDAKTMIRDIAATTKRNLAEMFEQEILRGPEARKIKVPKSNRPGAREGEYVRNS